MINKGLEDHTGQNLDKINTDTERDNFMSAEEAVTYRLVDKVIVRPEEKSDKDE
jgi:ATP-dependent Clp protease protease subunit